MASATGMTARLPLRNMVRAALGGGLALLLAWPGLAMAQAAAGNPPIDSDLARPGAPATPTPPAAAAHPGSGYTDPTAQPRYLNAPPEASVVTASAAGGFSCATTANGQTYHQDDLIAAAENAFGKGAHGLAIMIRDILAKQGEPNGYITGREASGAFAVGLRYGSGMLCDKAVGRMPVYWTGPSIGFDIGGSAAKTFVLVYNLRQSDELFRRFVAGEGQAYLVGGFHVSYLRHGNVVLIPVRMGVGLRLGVNGGYMKVTRNLNYLPF